MDWKNKLYFGDNLDILRAHVADASVDLMGGRVRNLRPPWSSYREMSSAANRPAELCQ
jgi:hypothetical protein